MNKEQMPLVPPNPFLRGVNLTLFMDGAGAQQLIDIDKANTEIRKVKRDMADWLEKYIPKNGTNFQHIAMIDTKILQGKISELRKESEVKVE